MIKLKKKIKLLKNFKMQHTLKINMPLPVKEKDVHSMFLGLLKIVKEMAKREAETMQLHSDISYNNLKVMYLTAVKKMNKYKSLYLNSLKEAK